MVGVKKIKISTREKHKSAREIFFVKFHEIYEENILIMKFVTIICRNVSKCDFKWKSGL